MAQRNLTKKVKGPKGVILEKEEGQPHYGRFIAYPFERGCGTTIGNSLRRILLSSIEGYAPVYVQITTYGEGGSATLISSEFESIPGVVEDTPIIIANLKRLNFKLSTEEEEKTILVEWKGAGEMTGNELARDGIEVLNGDVKLCTAMEDAHFEMRVHIEKGRGYVSVEQSEEKSDMVGTIPIDAIFSPVQKVNLEVQETRLGRRSDYDKLVLEVWTDGTVEPTEAVGEAAQVAQEHFSAFIGVVAGGRDLRLDEELEEEEERIRTILNTSVEELELSVRSSNCLRNADILTIGDLTRKQEEEIAQTKNFGRKSMTEIKEKLGEWGLSLGMTDYSTLKEALLMKGKKETEEVSDHAQ